MITSEDIIKNPLFAELTINEVKKIKHLIFEKKCNKGATLFLEGMPGGVLYIIKSGQVDILKKKDKEELLITTLKRGDFVGEMSLIDDEPRSATARVKEAAVLLGLSKHGFQELISEIPEGANKIMLFLIKILIRRLRETNNKLVNKVD